MDDATIGLLERLYHQLPNTFVDQPGALEHIQLPIRHGGIGMRSLLNTSNAAYYGSTRRTELVRHLITGEDEDGIAGVFSVLTEAVASEMDRSADRALPSGLLRDYATRLRGTPLSMANAWNHHFLQVRDCTFLKPLTPRGIH